MISINSPYISQQSQSGILINQHITVQAASEATGYNIQYLRRLLRSDSLRGIKIDQIWLIEMESLKSGINLDTASQTGSIQMSK